MNKLTYRQAYDKIIEAYFKDEIKPFDREFCFCGTLGAYKKPSDILNDWCVIPSVRWDYELYENYEYHKMERALLGHLRDKLTTGFEHDIYIQSEDARQGMKNHPNYEDVLFEGMSAALDVLKEIHRARGENVDDVPVFTKRNIASPLNV